MANRRRIPYEKPEVGEETLGQGFERCDMILKAINASLFSLWSDALVTVEITKRMGVRNRRLRQLVAELATAAGFPKVRAVLAIAAAARGSRGKAKKR